MYFVLNKLHSIVHATVIADGTDFWIAVATYGALFIIPLGYLFVIFLKSWRFRTWNRQAIKNTQWLRQLEFDRIKEEQHLLDDDKRILLDTIATYSFDTLTDALQRGIITAVDAVNAFRYKALNVTEQFNCVTCFVKESVEIAGKLDARYGMLDEKPPLFGIPFSVKDNFMMPSYQCTRGLAKQLNVYEQEECSLITHLKSLGAVPLVRTNVPQTLLSYMCSNPVYGTTLNPHDVKRTPGGSSGGEACMIAARGVPFGIASDLAGSMRIPAHFSGNVTLKPSAARLVVTGAYGVAPGISRISLAYGFMANDMSTLRQLYELTLVDSYFKMVPRTIPLPLDHNKLSKGGARLRIGYAFSAGWFESTPSVVRAVTLSKEILENQGHELVPFLFPFDSAEVFANILKALTADNGNYLLNQCFNHEPVDPLIYPTYISLKFPLIFRGILSMLTWPFWARISVMAGSYTKSVDEIRRVYAELDYLRDYFATYLAEQQIDALVLPVLPFPALPHEYPAKLFAAIFPVILFNVLDLPAGCLPVTCVNCDDVDSLRNNYPVSAPPDPLYSLAKTAVLEGDPLGLPVGVQVVSGLCGESTCLTVMKQLEDNCLY